MGANIVAQLNKRRAWGDACVTNQVLQAMPVNPSKAPADTPLSKGALVVLGD